MSKRVRAAAYRPPPINTEREKLIPLACPKELGIDVHRTTIERWATHGIRRRTDGLVIRLAKIYAGRLAYTTKQALARFIRDCSEGRQ